MNEKNNCPKCNGQMEQGFIPDYSHGGTVAVGSWHKGLPKKDFWTRTKAIRWEGIPMAAFRCSACGFIEIYSREEFAAK